MIKFRPIEKEALQILKKWRNSDNIMSFVREYRYLNDSDQERWFESYLTSRRRTDFDHEILIILNNNGMIGVGGFTRIEWKNRKAELTLYFWKRDVVWYWQQVIKSLLDKGFNEFGFHKITWPVYSHDPNLELYKTLFDVEAVLKEEYWYNGWQDRIYLSKLNPIILDK